MRDWKTHGHGLGVALLAYPDTWVDFTFASDILMLALALEQSMDMLRSCDSCVGAIRNVGRILNVSKTKLSNNASPST